MSKKYNFIIIMHNSDVKNIAFKNKTTKWKINKESKWNIKMYIKINKLKKQKI